MKKFLVSVATLTAIAAATPAFAQAGSTSSADASASATIVTPIGLTNNQNMSFGTFATNGVDSEISTAEKNSALHIATSAAPAPALFNVTGDGALAYSATVPADVTLSQVDAEGAAIAGGQTMKATLTLQDGNTGRKLSDGKGSVQVNGTLKVGASQAAGTYKGKFTVSVQYN